MEKRRAIAMVIGAVVTVVVFGAAVYLLVYGGFYTEKDRLVHLSIGLGPVAAFSVVMGYGAWWMVMFVLTLLDSGDRPARSPREIPTGPRGPNVTKGTDPG